MIRAALVAALLAGAGCVRAMCPTPAPAQCREWDCKFDKADTPRECVCVDEG